MVEKHFSFLVTPEDVGIRLDLYLSRQAGLPRSQIQQLIEKNEVQVNKKKSKPAQKLHLNDEVEISIPPPVVIEATPEAIPLKIIYEDPDLAVIDKPAGLVVHASAGHFEGTLVNALLYHLKDLSDIGGALRPGIVHRLDKGTSGIMLVAKNNQTHAALSQQFQNRKIQKTYWALSYGSFKSAEGCFASQMGRSRGDRKKISSKTRRGKEAITFYRVLKSYQGVSEVELKPKTGRTHQLRVHLAESGHPILGDPVYGGKQWSKKVSEKAQGEVSRLTHQVLHAWKIGFEHPRLKQWLEFEAKIPEEFIKLLKLLGAE